jgi:hypothetical protein
MEPGKPEIDTAEAMKVVEEWRKSSKAWIEHVTGIINKMSNGQKITDEERMLLIESQQALIRVI